MPVGGFAVEVISAESGHCNVQFGGYQDYQEEQNEMQDDDYPEWLIPQCFAYFVLNYGSHL